jgi:hypothetical protein
MKKREFIFSMFILLSIVLFILIISKQVLSQSIPDNTLPGNFSDDNIEDLNRRVTDVNDIVENYSRQPNRTKYMAERFQKLLLNFTIVQRFDILFRQLSPMIWFFTGVEYSLTFKFFLAIFIYIMIFIKVPEIVKYSTGFKEPIPTLISITFMILIAQIGFFSYFSSKIIDFLSNQDNLALLVLFSGLFFTLIAMIFIFESYCASYLKQSKEKQVKKEAEETTKSLKKVLGGLTNT